MELLIYINDFINVLGIKKAPRCSVERPLIGFKVNTLRCITFSYKVLTFNKGTRNYSSFTYYF